MRKADVAEVLLSLVGSPERARSFVGDLIEERGHGAAWFWRSVARLWLAMLGRDLMTAPIKMTISCAIAWFVYMLLSAVLALAGYVIVTLAWGIAYVLSNHTGLELLTDLMRVRLRLQLPEERLRMNARARLFSMLRASAPPRFVGYDL